MQMDEEARLQMISLMGELNVWKEIARGLYDHIVSCPDEHDFVECAVNWFEEKYEPMP